MRYRLLVILLVFSFISCNTNINKDKLDDKSKRNPNWVWWVDAKTGKASWILINAPDADPVESGKFTRFYFNGNVFRKGTRVDGFDVDTTFNYDLKGILYGYTIYKNNTDTVHYFLRNGPIKLFYADGKIADSGVVENHNYGNKWIRFYDNGKRSYSRDFKNDTGWVTNYYYNGKIEDSDYNEGPKVFNLKHWFKNGQLEYSNEFKNHNYNGLQKRFFENGHLKGVGTWVNGEGTGPGESWYESGKLHSRAQRLNGELNGYQIIYFENGKTYEEAYYKGGKLDGEAKKFDEKGKLMADRIFKDGLLIEDKLKATSPNNHK